MKRIPKLWTGLGVAAIAGSMAAQADVITLQKDANQSPIILAQEAGEGGEGGGEGGGAAPTTYALESTDANAFKYDAAPRSTPILISSPAPTRKPPMIPSLLPRPSMLSWPPLPTTR